MDIRKYIKIQRSRLSSKKVYDVSSCKKQKAKSDDSVVIEYRPYDTRSSSDIANTPSVESEVKRDVDIATGEVGGLNMPPKCSSDSDLNAAPMSLSFFNLKNKFCI